MLRDLKLVEGGSPCPRCLANWRLLASSIFTRLLPRRLVDNRRSWYSCNRLDYGAVRDFHRGVRGCTSIGLCQDRLLIADRPLTVCRRTKTQHTSTFRLPARSAALARFDLEVVGRPRSEVIELDAMGTGAVSDSASASDVHVCCIPDPAARRASVDQASWRNDRGISMIGPFVICNGVVSSLGV